MARGAEVELPAAEMVHRLYDKAAASGSDKKADIAAVTQLYQGEKTA